ncbi:DapH/DapD/GlmU-related protein [Lactococcus termiticola]|uniref:Chloramphenicol acetyltransferase n=1 Tax=Lactococcus termiticola TaxID=2169526 RepID=A0A2R5HD09_9LACT|nr:DapH/DapD/GlmU-related protein [Lactococcus termiticola]GBG95902.1 chloramphenicol acetyltransferase [Lactococcus termiticola]
MTFNTSTLNFVESGVEISETAIADNGVWIRYGSVITNSIILENVFIGFKCQIQNAQINQSVEIATGVKILGTRDHPVRINKFSWVGAKATIQQGIKIGEGCIIGAGSFVRDNVADYTIVIGNPAKILKVRNSIIDKFPVFQEFLSKVKADYSNHRPDYTKKYLNLTTQKFDDSQIGNDTILQGKRSSAFPNAGIKLGDMSYIGNNCVFESSGGINIGNNSLIADKVTLVSISHDYKKLSLPTIVDSIHIGNNVKVGKNSLILLGARIRDGTIIPEDSIVLKDKIIESVL